MAKNKQNNEQKENSQELRTLRQIPFQNTLVVVGEEEHQYEIQNITTPDEGPWVYVVKDLEDGPALMITPDNMDGVHIEVKSPINA